LSVDKDFDIPSLPLDHKHFEV